MRPILLLIVFLSIAWSEQHASRSLRKKRHYGCAQSCGQTCNSCNQGSCSGSCQSCISQNCCTNCCVNQCNVCQTQSCQSNNQCNQCCSQHCVAPTPLPQASNQTTIISTDTNADIRGSINITNIVFNRNNVSVPITITNNNQLTTEVDEESQCCNGSYTGSIIAVKDREIYRPYPVPYPVHIPYRVPVHVPYPIRVPIHIPIRHNVPVPVPIHHRVPVPVPIHHQVPVPIHHQVPIPIHHQVPVSIHHQVPVHIPIQQHVYPPVRFLPIPVPIPQPIHTHPCYGVQCQPTREYFNRKICETKSGQRCKLVRHDCNLCDEKFYESDETYQRCYGCYL